MIKKKGVMDMTETLENFTRIMENYKTDKNYNIPKLDIILKFIKLKRLAKQRNEIIQNFTEKNKKIRNGQIVIKGTRITPEELMLIVDEAFNEKKDDINSLCNFIKEQYPSIDSKEQIIAGISYNIRKMNTLKFILGIIKE